MGVGEGADEGVREDDAADQVVGELALDGNPKGLLEEHPPGVVVTDARPECGAGGKRPCQGGEDPFGDVAHRSVEPLPGGVLAVAAGERGEGGAGAVLSPADEQAGGAAVAQGRGVRGDGALPYREVEPELADDLLRQEADEVRVAGEACVDPGEGPGGDGGSAGPAEALQDEDGASCAGQVGGGDQTVVATADDHDVVRVTSGCVHVSS